MASSYKNKALVWRGSWSDSTDYMAGDIVRYNGLVYLSVIPSHGSTPNSLNDWTLLNGERPVPQERHTLDRRGNETR